MLVISQVRKARLPALGIGVEINFESEANKIDCNAKPDPKGNAQLKMLNTLTILIKLNNFF